MRVNPGLRTKVVPQHGTVSYRSLRLWETTYWSPYRNRVIANIEYPQNSQWKYSNQAPQNVQPTFNAIGVRSHSSGGIFSCAVRNNSRTDKAAACGCSWKLDNPGFTCNLFLKYIAYHANAIHNNYFLITFRYHFSAILAIVNRLNDPKSIE